MGKTVDVTGQRFGRLVVIGRTKGPNHHNAYWECQCDCGKTVIVTSAHLSHGDTKSCGCLKIDVMKQQFATHGESRGGIKTREYRIWIAMRERCYCPTNAAYQDYGGRGITISENWLNSFGNFLSDMGRAPKGHTIERKDNSKGYSKDNCVWATYKQQNNNRRDNIIITHDDKTMTISQWADDSGVNLAVLRQRLNRLGWSMEKAIKTPVRSYSRKDVSI